MGHEMKPAKGVENLAARLVTASTTPLVQTPIPDPLAHPTPEPVTSIESTPIAKKAGKGTGTKEVVDTMALTLRPTRALHARYVAAAIKRSQKVGRVVSVQEIMLEVLEKGGV